MREFSIFTIDKSSPAAHRASYATHDFVATYVAAVDPMLTGDPAATAAAAAAAVVADVMSLYATAAAYAAEDAK